MGVPAAINQDPLAFLIFSTALGAVIGSFLNVVIYRLPRGESLAYPASHCPQCGHGLCAWDNIPLLSWLALAGRCRHCSAKISVRYPVVELLTAAVFALSALEFGPTIGALSACVLSAALIAVTFIDLDHLLILDRMTVGLAVAGIVLAAASGRLVGGIQGAALGAALFGGIYLLTRGKGMGLGDVKLAMAAGLFLGLAASIAAFLSAFVIGSLLAVPVLAAGSRGRRDALPFGPFLVLAILLVLFAPASIFGPFESYRNFIGGLTSR
ncbi:MAG: prepilin peptidase [Candidatus Eremiobacteraeota bacterium]|nr:prepilin peptidase [Candidatus Eremiobacteraeota bacterium]MBC5827409.1 prepilin peptidase [Candidatus Eremiobacteraeota bacterium]